MLTEILVTQRKLFTENLAQILKHVKYDNISLRLRNSDN